ncbi:ATP-dependent DNA helicase PcrA [Sulfurihydrogenibium azorense Az-Fu1]|uniref:DNA 3'-5' helicase n=1 Tax=Sulfurihydrogenibium azorense (strain DSM 15241 / OCM 825 / Az-Fu1) TaxID=204536 RepID=C1DXV4_SULAA|nr:UvrD-helicase domain-containing protein [Sulfurihydrogenibium azorense]ACN99209.1 ATP-dependent DNA helicase PcrA [Sulfurihydrogenibium azorense Az-Fu1]
MLRDPILDGLNDRQKEAVLHFESPLLVLAGAGSGKTKVITHKIMYLVKSLGIPIHRILAITFTNKAAEEMKERVEKALGERPQWVMTFHSFAAKFLRFEAEKVGYDRNFVIYDEDDSKKLIKKVLKDLNLNEELIKPDKVKDYISKIKQEDNPEEYLDLLSFSVPHIRNIYEKYEEDLKNSNAFDFDDLLVKSVKILKNNPEILQRWQNKFDYILVDEYQDTNKVQHQLLKLLVGSRNTITVVGDPAQCIYTWRGAHPENILDFEKDFPGTKIIKLERNYRSTKKILDAANAVISKSKGKWKSKLLTLWTEKEEGEEIRLVALSNEKEEASFIARKIKELSSATDYKDFAILVRMSFLTRNLEEAMMLNSIPYQIVGGLKFYERAEVKDILSYLRLALNPKDYASFERSLTTPPRGIGEKGLEVIKSNFVDNWIEALKKSLPHFNQKVKSSIKEYLDLMDYVIENANLNPSKVVKHIFEKIKYEEYLQKEYSKDWEDRVANINELIVALEEIEKSGKTLTEFLEESSLSQAQDNLEDTNKVKIMTVHAAKGLEFNTVFVAGLEDGIFPSGRSFDDPTQLEEERRLFYVAITRAKERLFLTYAKERKSFGNKSVPTKLSQFLKDIKEHVKSQSTSKSASPQHTAVKYKTNKPSDGEIEAGMLVKHQVFGKGVVKSVIGKNAKVLFEKHGEKTIHIDFLEKV